MISQVTLKATATKPALLEPASITLTYSVSISLVLMLKMKMIYTVSDTAVLIATCLLDKTTIHLNMAFKAKGMKYSVRNKLHVVKFASDNSSNSAASQEFDVDEKLVQDWRRHIDKIQSLPKSKGADWGKEVPNAQVQEKHRCMGR